MTPQLSAGDTLTSDGSARIPAPEGDRGDVTGAVRPGRSPAPSRRRQRRALVVAVAMAAGGLAYLICSERIQHAGHGALHSQPGATESITIAVPGARRDTPAVHRRVPLQRALVCAVAADEVIIRLACNPIHAGHADSGVTEMLLERCEHAAESASVPGGRQTGEALALHLRELGGRRLERLGALLVEDGWRIVRTIISTR